MPMNEGEGHCMRCHKPVKIKDSKIATAKNGMKMLKGVCPNCGTKVQRFLGKKGGDADEFTEPTFIEAESPKSGGAPKRRHKSRSSKKSGGRRHSRSSGRKSRSSKKSGGKRSSRRSHSKKSAGGKRRRSRK